MKHLIPISICLALCCHLAHAQARPIHESPDLPQPDQTLLFAQRDTCDLRLDFYSAGPGNRPLIIHVFGGGFVMGVRNHPDDRPWYRQMADAGYHVAAIDYRLGLKNKTIKGKLSMPPILDEALQAAVDDLYAATNYLLEHASELGIDPDHIIISGSSAGAMTVLQAEWERCNGKPEAQVLPDGFRYAGVMAFAGAVLSVDGPILFPQKPCPIMLLYGTADKMVPPGSITFFRNHFAGSETLAKKLADIDANFQVFRFDGAGHEISVSMRRNVPEELRFLEENVLKGVFRPLDATLSDAGMQDPGWGTLTTWDLYNNTN